MQTLIIFTEQEFNRFKREVTELITSKLETKIKAAGGEIKGLQRAIETSITNIEALFKIDGAYTSKLSQIAQKR